VVIVGAQKAATTGLLHSLAQHPGVVTPRVQEVTALHTGAGQWAGWVSEYEPQLEKIGPEQLLLVKLATAMHFPDTLQTVKQLNPAVRVIAILRHPVDRMLSLHRYATQHGMESRCAEEALRDDVLQRAPQWRLTTYSGGSRYASAIEALHETFAPDDILFLDYADAFRPASLEKTQNFMGLDRIPLVTVRANESRLPRSGTVARATNSSMARAFGRVTVPARWREAVRRLLQSLNASSRSHVASTISAGLRSELLERHAVDVDAAALALGRSLVDWRR
jgi:hypothetical protein